jgi:hypothetical protein
LCHSFYLKGSIDTAFTVGAVLAVVVFCTGGFDAHLEQPALPFANFLF